jgi:hypothetical protein
VGVKTGGVLTDFVHPTAKILLAANVALIQTVTKALYVIIKYAIILLIVVLLMAVLMVLYALQAYVYLTYFNHVLMYVIKAIAI